MSQLFFFVIFFLLIIHVLLLTQNRQDMSNLAASREPWLSKPGPLIADPSNTAAPATASHRATAAAEAERRIHTAIAAQRAAEGSPVITPPPETPTSTTNSTTQPLTSIKDDEDSNKLDKLRNLGENLARQGTTKSKQLTK